MRTKYEDLRVWVDAINLADVVYKTTRSFLPIF